ncbi:putative xyloglucan endotransglucosylase/hydrolase protein 9 isoform X2 [Iris pallida]|uniref:Xyloglucan endotransglucosylase/hydrolase protein 9 isoform X2 n=1 Tax=Iris pallida TaxID=29817 RepID=A0AAX6DK55_IRIPA|nr:putative xyloglucan endotransglucosylase/hydrolase protein 9 isoform X2 [Iris pallida]
MYIFVQELGLLREQVPVREGDGGDEAGGGGLGGDGDGVLHVVGGAEAQRVRLRVPGEHERRAVPGPDQHLHRRGREQGAEDGPVVRPHRGLPLVLDPVEPEAGGVPRGRDAGAGVREPGEGGGRVPGGPADGGVQLAVERGRLGHAGGEGQDGLVARAVRDHVRGPAGGRVPGRGGGAAALESEVRRCSASESGEEGRYWWKDPVMQELSVHQSHQLMWVRAKHLVYDYCADSSRFPTKPAECGR